LGVTERCFRRSPKALTSHHLPRRGVELNFESVVRHAQVYALAARARRELTPGGTRPETHRVLVGVQDVLET